MLSPEDIDWILCDLGKTLVNFDHRLAVRNLLSNPKLSGLAALPTDEDIMDFMFHSAEGAAISHSMDRGLGDMAWLGERLSTRFGLQVPHDEMERAWSEIFLDLIPGAEPGMRRAQANGVRVAICSNTNAAHIDQVNRQHPGLLAGWDALFYSYEMGMAKGDLGFFTRIANEVNSPPSRILLVDDLPANITAAESEGVRGLLFTGVLPDWEVFR